MITRSDCSQVCKALAMAEELYFCQHPLEIFCEVPRDGVHWKKVVDFAKQKQWFEMKEYMDWMGETYLRETMKHWIQYASPRLYQEIWVEKSPDENHDS